MSQIEDSPIFTEMPDEVPEQYDDVTRWDALSPEERDEVNSLAQNFAITANLSVGELPPVGATIENVYEGETKADALGRAYVTRDQIRDAGGSCEVEYIGPHHIKHNRVYHEIHITITED